MQDKLIELETRYSFQEDMLQELNEIVIKQQQQLDALNQGLRLLREQMSELEAQQPGQPGAAIQDEKPPHY